MKTSLYIILIFPIALAGWLYVSKLSKEYWVNVGPTWNLKLNPDVEQPYQGSATISEETTDG